MLTCSYQTIQRWTCTCKCLQDQGSGQCSVAANADLAYLQIKIPFFFVRGMMQPSPGRSCLQVLVLFQD